MFPPHCQHVDMDEEEGDLISRMYLLEIWREKYYRCFSGQVDKSNLLIT
jgi:hypothetical protein